LCFRAKPDEKDIYLQLQEVVELAKKVGGPKHNFKYIQVPTNLAMPESFAEKWQELTESGKTTMETLFTVAKRNKINVVTSSALAQGLMMQVPLSTDLFKCQHVSAKHIQFTRSLPAESLICKFLRDSTYL
jgi:hypothetical protein